MLHLLLLLERSEAGSHGLLVLSRQLSGGRVFNVVLASHWVEVDLLGLLDLLDLLSLLLAHGSLEAELLLHVSELLLLLVDGQLLLGELRVVEIQLLELLSGSLHASKLLLKSLLLLSQIHVGSDKLSIEVRIHLFLLLFHCELGRSQDLLNGVLLVHHVAVAVLSTKLGESGLGGVVVILTRGVRVSIHRVSSKLMDRCCGGG